MMNKLLLHHCCAPCSPKVVEMLSRRFAVESFWYNPNIHPAEEQALRKSSLETFCHSLQLRLHAGPLLTQEEWLAPAPKAPPERCRFCYRIRLRATAERARELGIAYFSTTLLASPYQKHELVRDEGLAAAGSGVSFEYGDFRPYFFQGKDEARQKGLYLQKYCGCSYSKEERYAPKKGGE